MRRCRSVPLNRFTVVINDGGWGGKRWRGPASCPSPRWASGSNQPCEGMLGAELCVGWSPPNRKRPRKGGFAQRPSGPSTAGSETRAVAIRERWTSLLGRRVRLRSDVRILLTFANEKQLQQHTEECSL